MTERLGRRVADLRAKLGWTQQELADRLAISRVAVSHLESGLSEPGERTVTLLAGVFKVEPHELVADTTYPAAKADRLPLVAARYTEAELQLRLAQQDLERVELLAPHEADAVLRAWLDRLRALRELTADRSERDVLAEAAGLVARGLDAALVRRSPPD